MVSYHIQLLDLSSHLLRVTLQFDSQPEGLLRLPAWIPGSYMVRDFAKHIIAIKAEINSVATALVQIDKQTWQYQHHPEQQVFVSYDLYAFDLSVRANYLSSELLVLNPAASCLEVVGLSDAPQQLIINIPSQLTTWRLACALHPKDLAPALTLTEFTAQSYQQLIDSPVIAGELQLVSFELSAIPHHLVFVGAYQADLCRIAADLAPICQQQINVFGGLPADLEQYWFLNWAVDKGYGGLEHQHSTLLMMNKFDLPNPQLPSVVTEEYQNYLALCSHEYFHLWWVTRAKPAELMPYQLHAEQYTNQLWLYEGFTSYFDDLSLVRSGKISANQYLQTLSQTITRVGRSPANTVQSLCDSSFTAWTKFYKQDENAQNAVVSYYAKGSLVALCLDAALRVRGFVLEDLMRLFYREFASIGSTEARIFAQLLELTHDQTLVDDLRDWITSAKDLPLQRSLNELGINLQLRSPSSAMDFAGEKTFDLAPRDLGFQYEQKPEGLSVISVRHHSPAQQAGVANQDLIVALDGIKASESNIQQVLSRYPLGSTLAMHVFRQQRLLQLEFTLAPAPETTAVLAVIGDTTPSWLAVTLQ